jgi:hypothetical protein
MMDAALELLGPYGPDLRNGLTNHAPMAVEALAAMGRADAVQPWLAGYAPGMLPRPQPRERIDPDDWASALGREDRFADWSAFFADALEDAPWRAVLARWTALLAPALCASAMHGVIRTGHAARSLAEAETPARRRELADGLGYWAAAHQMLPGVPRGGGRLAAREAIADVPVVPAGERTFTGTIVSSLVALDRFPPFAPVIDLLDVRGDPNALLSDMSETFARVYLTNARDFLSALVFIHGVTSIAAVRSLLPVLPDPVQRDVIRYAWQGSCALYAAFSTAPPLAGEIEPPRESDQTLVAMAIANGDDHAIKFTETCLREHALRASAAYLAAARHASGILVAP